MTHPLLSEPAGTAIIRAIHGAKAALTANDTPQRPDPANVYEAVARVMEELPAIGKDEQAPAAMGGYAYRGIEAITAHASKLCGRYRVLLIPKVVKRRVEPITIQNRPWTETTCKIVYRVVGPGGAGDEFKLGPIYAVALDNSDKGQNKVMTQAYKQALLQLFMVGEKAHDVDSQAAEVESRGDAGGGRRGKSSSPPEGKNYDGPPAPAEKRDDLALRIRSLPDANRAELKKAWAGNLPTLNEQFPTSALSDASRLVMRQEAMARSQGWDQEAARRQAAAAEPPPKPDETAGQGGGSAKSSLPDSHSQKPAPPADFVPVSIDEMKALIAQLDGTEAEEAFIRSLAGSASTTGADKPVIADVQAMEGNDVVNALRAVRLPIVGGLRERRKRLVAYRLLAAGVRPGAQGSLEGPQSAQEAQDGPATAPPTPTPQDASDGAPGAS